MIKMTLRLDNNAENYRLFQGAVNAIKNTTKLNTHLMSI